VASRVIIVGSRRGNSSVPVSELRQMMGRAGRDHDGGTSIVDLIVEEDDEERVVTGIEDNAGLEVRSVIGDVDVLAFHLLPELCSGRATTVKDAEEWLSRSFCAHMGGSYDVEGVLTLLEGCEAIKRVGDRCLSTTLGEVSASLYFHPADAMAWTMNFSELFEQDLQDDDVAPAWALGNVPVMRGVGDFGKHRWVIGEFMNLLPSGLTVEDGCMVNSTLWWHCMGGPAIGGMKGKAMEMRDDFGRVLSLLRLVDAKVTRWGKSDWLDDLELRVRKGIQADMVWLMKIPGMRKSMAQHLYNMDVREPADLESALAMIDGEENEQFVEVVRAAL